MNQKFEIKFNPTYKQDLALEILNDKEHTELLFGDIS